jgi:hypothetical protein
MPIPSDLAPKQQRRVMDLVREAGISVRDWGNYEGGKANAAANPKYCYEWAFLDPNKVLVLNLWYRNMRERNGSVYQELNLRKLAAKHSKAGHHTPAKRAARMDDAIQRALREGLPVRVIVCDGRMRNLDEPGAKASRVSARTLDSEPWAVTNYDSATGDCVLTRGARPKPEGDDHRESEDSLGLNKPFAPKSSEQYLAIVSQAEQRRSRIHEDLVNKVAKLLARPGVRVQNPKPIDLLVSTPHPVIIEAKTCARINPLFAIREAVGQLFEYRRFSTYRDAAICILLDVNPGKMLVDYVENDIGLGIIWLEGETLMAGPVTASKLSPLKLRTAK